MAGIPIPLFFALTASSESNLYDLARGTKLQASHLPFTTIYPRNERVYQNLHTLAFDHSQRSAFVTDKRIESYITQYRDNVEMLETVVQEMEHDLALIRHSLKDNQEVVHALSKLQTLPICPLPALPEDILRYIIAEAASEYRGGSTVLSRVSREVQKWSDAVMFRKLTFRWPYFLPFFLRCINIDDPSPRIVSALQQVRHLCINSFVGSYDQPDKEWNGFQKFMTLVPNIHTLGVIAQHDLSFIPKAQVLLRPPPGIITALRHLYCDPQFLSLLPPQDSPESTFPFQQITHLTIMGLTERVRACPWHLLMRFENLAFLLVQGGQYVEDDILSPVWSSVLSEKVLPNLPSSLDALILAVGLLETDDQATHFCNNLFGPCREKIVVATSRGKDKECIYVHYKTLFGLNRKESRGDYEFGEVWKEAGHMVKQRLE